MERKMETNKTAVKSGNAKKKTAAIEPFAAFAEPAPAEKTVVKKTVAVSKTKAEVVSPVVKAAKKASKTIVADPFAETVETTSPVEKKVVRAAKTAVKALNAEKPAKVAGKKAAAIKVPAPVDVTESMLKKAAVSPVFKTLSEPTLPELPRENRARLQMQTPTRLYFYWSVKENPWALLKNVFGDDLGSYSLVLKLIDKKHGHETIDQTDAEGNYWFDVEPDGSYQAEIGFYAPNRPYFRVLYSNTIETPRRSPSPRAATEAKWTVSANKFAEVLDVAGFTRDAFDVAMAGDDHAAAEDVSHTAFSQFLGSDDHDFRGVAAEDIRYAMIALASGVPLEELRFKVSAALFAILQANPDSIESGKAMNALTEHFDIDETEFTEEQFGPAVFGASLVNFPKTLKTRTLSPKDASRYNPVSSHSLR